MCIPVELLFMVFYNIANCYLVVTCIWFMIIYNISNILLKILLLAAVEKYYLKLVWM